MHHEVISIFVHSDSSCMSLNCCLIKEQSLRYQKQVEKIKVVFENINHIESPHNSSMKSDLLKHPLILHTVSFYLNHFNDF